MELEENIVVYQAFLNEDILFSVIICLKSHDDFSFILEIISEGEHIVSKDASIPSKISPLWINSGITHIKFTKILGASFWNTRLDLLEAPEPECLTMDKDDSVAFGLISSCHGSSWNLYVIIGSNIGTITFYNTSQEVYLDSFKWLAVDYAYFYDSAITIFGCSNSMGPTIISPGFT